MVENTLIPDAKVLIQQAYAQLNNTDPSSGSYASISMAISNLERIIGSGAPSQSDVMAGMSQLTRAMAGLD